MNIALFALAALMIVGGIVSVVQGFPFVRLESGLAMTIAGATTASAGAVVLGLAVVARRLRGLEQAWSGAGASRPDVAAAPFEPEPAAPSARQRPSLAATAASLGGLAGASVAGASLANGRAGREPAFFDPTPPEPVASGAPHDASAEDERAMAEPLLPNLLPESEAAPTPSEPLPPSEPVFVSDRVPPPEDDLPFAAPEPAMSDAPYLPKPPDAAPVELLSPEPPSPEPLPVVARPEPVASPPAEPAPPVLPPARIETAEFRELPPEPAPEPPAAPEVEAESQVVGTYASGGNTYVMYATGVIEADTPRGRYTFASLDELKAFVEAGGETDARGAA